MRRGWSGVAVALVLTVLAGCGGHGAGVSSTGSLAAAARTDDFVSRVGARFEVDGLPFRFVGFNLYDAAASDIYSCSPSTRLDDAALAAAMTSIRDRAGATVVRFWAYQTYTAGGTDFSGTDRVIDAARSAGLRVLPVLEDGPGNCSTGQRGLWLAGADEGTWFTEGYRHPYGSATVSYRDYVRTITHHYRDDPTILGWSLLNEAETSHRTGGESDLVRFARDMADVVHQADPHHLVTLGTQSNGAPGASGPDFAAVYGLSGLDFAEVHDYAVHGSDASPMPGSVAAGLPAVGSATCRRTDAPIACSFAIAVELGKPLVVAEAGITVDDAAGRRRRAGQLGAKMRAAFREGADGYLVWQLNRSNTDGFGVRIGSSDPLFAVMKTQSRALG